MDADDSEIWSKDLKCLVCRVTCDDEQKKAEHQKTKEHLKRWGVKKFIDDSIGRITTAMSQMHERYKLKKVPIIGLEECFEIQQEGLSDHEKANFWACNLCYEVGATYDTADIHLTSMQHIRNYLDENDSDKNEKIEEECKNDECDKYEKYRAAAEEIFETSGGITGIQSAQVLRLELNTDDGRKKLGIEDQMEVTFRPFHKKAQSVLLLCSTCNEVSPVQTAGKYTNEKACANHCESLNHQRCSRIMAVMNEFDPQEVYDEYRTAESVSQLHWEEKEPGAWYLSQPCGYRYSIKAGNETMCTVCFSLVKTEKILEHFTSEYHIMKYLNMINSYQSYLAHQLTGSDRRAKALLTLKGTITLENDTRKIAHSLSRLPNFIKTQLSDDIHQYEDPPVEIIDDFIESTGKVYRFCHSCTTYMEFDHSMVDTPIKMEFAWKKHVLNEHHFEIAAMRARINFDPKYFVPYSPTIHNTDTEIKGTWKINKDVLIQTQCDVGLEFMVEDEQANEVVCQCCWKIFSKNPVFVNQHIRSYDHLKQYVYIKAPNWVRTLLSPESDAKKQQLLMEFLQRHSGEFHKRIHLYSKLKTSELSSWAPISRRAVQSSLILEETDKEVYETVLNLTDQAARDGEENVMISAREALIAVNMLIINTSRGNQNELGSIVCRCENCELLVVANADTWQQDVFDNHICTDEHKRRMLLIKENTISAFGILPKKSDHTVKPFVQKDPSKKVTWQWKDLTKQHEYVASIVGLDCIIERHYPGMEFGMPKQRSDFFCRICAVVFQKRSNTLEDHVRSMDHCINWIHKYRPSLIRELFKHKASQDKGKELRKFLLGILKDVHPPEDYCMLVYDPIGEEERKQMAIITNLQIEEKKKKIAETKMIKEAERAKMAKQKEEERQRREEQMRKQQQKILDEENSKKALREARLKYAKEHVEKYKIKETPEEAALKSRLAHATSLEKQKQKFDVQQAKLEAERIQLLAKNPYATVKNAPQLVIMPQLRTQPPAQSPYGSIPVSSIPPRYDEQPPVTFFGSRPPISQPNKPVPGRPSRGFSMTFSKTFTDHTPPSAELDAYKKRPSLRGKRVDQEIHNTVAIRNKTDLINYMRKQGAEEILDPSEIPREFSQSVQDSPDAFGVEYVSEVVCLDDVTLDSYLCSVCDCWSDPKGMFRHLSSTDHKSSFMFHKYPHYHTEVTRERDPVVRRNIFKNFTRDLKEKNVKDAVKTRMKTLIDKETIARLWPGYEEHFFQTINSTSWSSGGFKPVAGPPIILPNVVPVARLINDDDDDIVEIDRREPTRKNTDYRGRDRSRSRDRSRRSRSREHNRRRRCRTRSRSRSNDRYYRSRRDRHSRSRSRSESRSRSRSRSRSPVPAKKKRQDSWTAQTESFLAKLGGDAKTAPPVVAPSLSTAADFNSKLATVRDLAASGVIQGTNIDSMVKSPRNEPAPVVPTQSTENRRRLEREKQEYEATVSRKIMGFLMMLDPLIKEHGRDIPYELVSNLYKDVGLSQAEGDDAVDKFLKSNKISNTFLSRQSISQSISSLGIQLNSTPVNHQYNQASQYSQQTGPPSHVQQYGISSHPTSSSAYSQAFHGSSGAPLSPISAAIVPLRSSSAYIQPQQQQQPIQSFYQNPPTAINHEGTSSDPSAKNNRSSETDDSSDDEDYKEVYQLLGTKKSDKQKKGVSEKEKEEEPIIPGQKMALKRTILPNGTRVGEVQAIQASPIVVASPTPSDVSSSNLAIRTPNSSTAVSTPVKPASQLLCPPLESSLGMPAPIAVTKQLQQQQQQQQQHQPQIMNYQVQQPGYQMNPGMNQYQQQPIYQQQPVQQQMQYQQPMYQQPQIQPQYQQQQYGIQPQMYQQQQQPPPQQVYQQQFYQQPQQQYYQQPPAQLQQPIQNNIAPSYGIGGVPQQPQQPQQYYWPPR